MKCLRYMLNGLASENKVITSCIIIFIILSLCVDLDLDWINRGWAQETLQVDNGEAIYGVVFFHSVSCGPCQLMKRDVWTNSKLHSTIRDKENPYYFYSVDTGKDSQFTKTYGVIALPYTVVFKIEDGRTIVLARKTGYISAEALCTLLKIINVERREIKKQTIPPSDDGFL